MGSVLGAFQVLMIFSRGTSLLRGLRVGVHRPSPLVLQCSSISSSSPCSDDIRRAQAKLLLKFAGRNEVFTAVSCFAFNGGADVNQESLRQVRLNLAKLNVSGTLTLGELEPGYNGAFICPTKHLTAMHDCLSAALGPSVDLNIGTTTDYAESGMPFPFKKLVVKTKNCVLTDGLMAKEGTGSALDLALIPADEISPAEWHQEVASLLKQTDESAPLLLDCRNQYESEMGTFSGATPLGTTVFADSWAKIDALLEGQPRDRRVLTFCTGGIRCEKVNAYLSQHLGMTNTGRLRKGIIHYESWIEEEREKEKEKERAVGGIIPLSGAPSPPSAPSSLFQGKNFLFDRRRLESGRAESGGPESGGAEIKGA